MGIFSLSFLRAWFGSEEYHEARHKRARTWSFPIRFWGRLIIAALGLCFFLWQQITEPSQWWGSDTFATLVLSITALQAAGPFFYLLSKFTLKFFLTEHYREALGAGKVYFTLKSALCILLTTVLSVLVAYGLLGSRWYVKLVAFLLSGCLVPGLPSRIELGRCTLDRLPEDHPQTEEIMSSRGRECIGRDGAPG
jgi:hypothetical protein